MPAGNWASGQPDKATKTGATGADVTMWNLDFLHDLFENLLFCQPSGVLTEGWNDLDPDDIGIRGLMWKTVATTYTAVAGERLMVNTASGAFTVTLPATPVVGDEVEIIDKFSSLGSSSACTIARNGEKIDGAASNVVLNVPNTRVKFVYCGAPTGDGTERGWVSVDTGTIRGGSGLIFNINADSAATPVATFKNFSTGTDADALINILCGSVGAFIGYDYTGAALLAGIFGQSATLTMTDGALLVTGTLGVTGLVTLNGNLVFTSDTNDIMRDDDDSFLRLCGGNGHAATDGAQIALHGSGADDGTLVLAAGTTGGDLTGAIIFKTGNSQRVNISEAGEIACSTALTFRTLASDPKDATPGNRPAGTLKEIAYYNGKVYLCTNASTPTWETITSS